MDKLTSIMVVVDQEGHNRAVLAKAMVLARHFRAKVELFLCDSEQAYALRHSYDSTGIARARESCLNESRRFLEALRLSIAAEDVSIATFAACESPLYQGIVQRVLESCPDLVIKAAAGEHPMRRFSLDANDWQLARTCPVPLMLTSGRAWRPQPRFAAAIDVSEQETSGLGRAILDTSEYIALGCHADLDVLYSERGGAEEGSRAITLRQLAHDAGVKPEHVHILRGEPEATLAGFASQRNYDVLVLGALTHRTGPAALVGTLTSRLVDALTCDFILVKPGAYTCPVTRSIGAVASA
jgi:universal stress protein E